MVVFYGPINSTLTSVTKLPMTFWTVLCAREEHAEFKKRTDFLCSASNTRHSFELFFKLFPNGFSTCPLQVLLGDQTYMYLDVQKKKKQLNIIRHSLFFRQFFQFCDHDSFWLGLHWTAIKLCWNLHGIFSLFFIVLPHLLCVEFTSWKSLTQNYLTAGVMCACAFFPSVCMHHSGRERTKDVWEQHEAVWI